MTSDPKRWLSEDGQADGFERALLESVRDVRPPDGSKDRAWRALATTLAASGAAASLAPSAAAAASGSVGTASATVSASAGKALMLKAAWTLAAGGLALGGYFAAEHVRPSAAPARPSAPAVQVTAPPAARPQKYETKAPELGQSPRAPSGALQAELSQNTRPQSGTLQTESALLTRARAALRAGETDDAQRFLRRMGSEFPRGVLQQEREVLAIEVLAARGDQAAAVKRARAFAKAFPGSPHTTRLRPLLDTP
jgi:hypothetical protein